MGDYRRRGSTKRPVDPVLFSFFSSRATGRTAGLPLVSAGTLGPPMARHYRGARKGASSRVCGPLRPEVAESARSAPLDSPPAARVAYRRSIPPRPKPASSPSATPIDLQPRDRNRTRRGASKRPSVIGLLGGVGSGKSAVAAAFARLGARVVDADAIVHGLYASPVFLARIARAFGRGVIGPGGRLDRARLADLVFENPGRLRRLERLVHPAVLRTIRAELRRKRRRTPIVLDVPLLLETGLDRSCDVLVYVAVPARIRLARLARNRSVSRAEAARRARFQRPLAEKRRRADAIVDNGRTRAHAARQVRRLWREWGLDLP